MMVVESLERYDDCLNARYCSTGGVGAVMTTLDNDGGVICRHPPPAPTPPTPPTAPAWQPRTWRRRPARPPDFPLQPHGRPIGWRPHHTPHKLHRTHPTLHTHAFSPLRCTLHCRCRALRLDLPQRVLRLLVTPRAWRAFSWIRAFTLYAIRVCYYTVDSASTRYRPFLVPAALYLCTSAHRRAVSLPCVLSHALHAAAFRLTLLSRYAVACWNHAALRVSRFVGFAHAACAG